MRKKLLISKIEAVKHREETALNHKLQTLNNVCTVSVGMLNKTLNCQPCLYYCKSTQLDFLDSLLVAVAFTD